MDWLLNKIIGIGYDEFITLSIILDIEHRVVKKDDRPCVVTGDYRPHRVNLSISSDYIIREAYLG